MSASRRALLAGLAAAVCMAGATPPARAQLSPHAPGEYALDAASTAALAARLESLRDRARGAGPSAIAGQVFRAGAENHHLEGMNCSDCHVMHASLSHAYESGTEETPVGEGAPHPFLLKDEVVPLCLACHDGQPGIPDVVEEDVNNPGERPDGTERAAGRFAAGAADNPRGHNLPGQGAFDLGECTWCHDPHGTEAWRDTWFHEIWGPGTEFTAFDRPTETSVAAGGPLAGAGQRRPGGTAAGVTRYRRDRVAYARNIADYFCLTCHGIGTPYNTRADRPGAHFARHPSSLAGDWIPLNGSEGGVPYHTDPAHWRGGEGTGFREGFGRVPFAVRSATDYAGASAVAEDNEVFCLSCHKAHGSGFAFGALWDVGSERVEERNAGCRQCHEVEAP